MEWIAATAKLVNYCEISPILIIKSVIQMIENDAFYDMYYFWGLLFHPQPVAESEFECH